MFQRRLKCDHFWRPLLWREKADERLQVKFTPVVYSVPMSQNRAFIDVFFIHRFNAAMYWVRLDEELYSNKENTEWYHVKKLGGRFATKPAAAYYSNGAAEVFAVDQDTYNINFAQVCPVEIIVT